MGRAPCCDKANVKKGPWSPEEDEKLKAYIEKYGTGGNWIALPQKIGLKRCGKSCRLRWLNYLRPNIKHGGFSEEEDNLICRLYISIGSRWSIIAAQLPGRTDNDIKNYWNTRLKKKLLGRQKQMNQEQSANGGNQSGKKSQLSNSAMERLQLHMQLQNLQDPLSIYNNPLLWPKLHCSQEKAIQNNLKAPSYSPLDLHPSSQQDYNQQPCPNYIPIQGNYPGIQELNVLELDTTSSGISSSSDGYNLMDSKLFMKSERVAPNFEDELDNILGDKSFSSSSSQQQGIAYDQFDCLKEMEGPKEGLTWWSNEMLPPTTSWGSTPALPSEDLQDIDQLGNSL